MMAQQLLMYGLSVFPCNRGTGTKEDRFKTPLDGFEWKELQQRHPTAQEVSAWGAWFTGRYGWEPNWAIITGAVSGIVVLDIDTVEGEAFVTAHGLPPTPSVRTSKGRHVYFRHPGYTVANKGKVGAFGALVPGCDFRGDGGYVMAPGSVHETGIVYEWIESIEDVELAEMPDWLVQAVTATAAPKLPTEHLELSPSGVSETGIAPQSPATARYTDAAVRGELAKLAAAVEGVNRNETLVRSAFRLGKFVGAGTLSRDEALGILREAVADWSDQRKTIDTITRAVDAGMASPKDLSKVGAATAEPVWPWSPGYSAGYSEEEQASDDDEIFRPTWDNEPPVSPPILTLNGVRIGSRGNITTIIAPASAGKSAVCEAIYAKYLNPECDAFGIELHTDGVVAYLDTERSKEDHWASWFRMTRRAGIERGGALGKPTSYGLYTLVPNIERRRQRLLELIESTPLGLLMLDGVGDFVLDVNDAIECNAFLYWLVAEAVRRDFGLLITIHPNPGDAKLKPRGHIGSEAWRKSETALFLSFDRATSQRTLTTNFELGKVRNARDITETYFAWDEFSGMFVSCENQLADTPNEKHLLEAVSELYDGRISYRYTELADTLKGRRGIGLSTAKRWIGRMKALDLIIEAPDRTLVANRNLVPE